MRKYLLLSILILSICALLSGCKKSGIGMDGQNQQNSAKTIKIVSGSENEDLQPLLDRFGRIEGVKVIVKYMGSVDIMQQIENPETDFDAVWPANSIWIALGDEKLKRVKNTESIMRSPVILCVKKSVAGRLGWIGSPVTVQDIYKAAEAGQLKLLSTSATQSNSGAAAYLANLYAFAGSPQVLEMKHLQDPKVIDSIKKMLKAINRSAASSGWLKKMFVENYDNYDAMVNYESLMIEANKQLTGIGKEPLYAVYPSNGMAIADSPLGYINKGDPKKEEIFLKLQKYLLSHDAQLEIQQHGSRTGIVGMDTAPNSKIFNPDWGVDTQRVISPIRMPQADVIREALLLYQTAFRKPSFTIYALDFSGSMHGNDGERQLKEAMRILLDQNEAKKYLLQTTPGDITVVIPFNGSMIWEKTVIGRKPEALSDMLNKIVTLDASGGTDIYSPVMRGFQIFKEKYKNLENYFPAIILMTDGRSNTDRLDDFKTFKQALNLSWDIPVFAITFGDADKSQLEALAQATSGHVYDGSKDLVGAFKKAKGNN